MCLYMGWHRFIRDLDSEIEVVWYILVLHQSDISTDDPLLGLKEPLLFKSRFNHQIARSLNSPGHLRTITFDVLVQLKRDYYEIQTFYEIYGKFEVTNLPMLLSVLLKCASA
jgi:hypothetical protein